MARAVLGYRPGGERVRPGHGEDAPPGSEPGVGRRGDEGERAPARPGRGVQLPVPEEAHGAQRLLLLELGHQAGRHHRVPGVVPGQELHLEPLLVHRGGGDLHALLDEAGDLPEGG